ncbi:MULTISPECIES: hypothetical protein [Streptomyces]|uniref:Lipoprotein n=1 Tax=Streptomyces huasconensis TaxID=1854574 RepID=A0ABV3LPR0_9ACTN|nr:MULTISPECIES: hypothetical protein [Streptomyces]UFQ15297.1 hypothetical protein J2N69_09935 [Streptomyces huasconensis]WCL84902.1 hypothetical protein PPN52_09945 [Streptomyces sp. JCM 35825]
MRTSVAVLATAGALTAGQLGMAGAASASEGPSARAASAAPSAAPRTAGCPIDIVYTSRFQIDRNGWVTNGGLYFGLKNKSTKSFKKVSFTVTNVKNIRFGRATPTGGKVTHKTSKTVTVYDKSLAGKAKLGVKVRTRLLNKNTYKVKFAVRGNGWNCSVDQGTWGA